MNQIFKSKIDTRIYKSIELPNKLLCLLISDKDTEKSAAALNVDVGSLCDPQERQGLAHFCEHMLFMGTEKYPQESEYQDFISKNSGQTNAFTSELNTNYIFQIANNSFYGALDRFAQFFISPLFSQSCTEREMKAVDSEYNMNLQNDFWRKFQLQHNAALPGSTYNKFMIGNLETLNFPDTRDYLLEFHKKYYSSNVMRLVVYGSQDIEQLENWTQELFSPIPNKDLNPPTFKDMPYNETNLGKLIKYVPIKDQDYLEVSWIIDYLYPHYQNCPGKYISHLLGHEGENSLLSHLIKQNLASELTCGSSESMKLFSILSVRIKLTKKGLANHDQVLKLVFEYVEMLKQKGTQQWVFEETKAIKDLEFSFKEKSKPFDFVSTLASRLQLYPPELVLKAPYLMENFQPDLIQRIINQLTTKNILVFLSTKDFKGQLGNQEHYFKTEYLLQNLPETIKQLQINNISPQLDLPPRNIFIPNTTEVLNNPNQLPEFPEKIFETEQSTVYFKQDNTFKVPKTVIQLRIFCKDQGYGTLEDTDVLGKLWKEFIKNHMRELNYQAETAQIESSFEMANNGIEISISGFNDSVDRFTISMFERLKSFKLEDYSDQFDTIYTKTVQELENFRKQPPYQQVHSYTQILLREGGSFDNENLLNSIKNVKYDDLLRFSNLWLKRAKFEWLISGNLIQEDAIKIANAIENLYQVQTLPKDQVLQVRTLNLPHEVVYNFTYNLKELTETNSAIVVYYQQEVSTIRSQVINDILANMLKSPFFQQLRTKEQLGYAVFSMISDIRGVQGLSFLIQSNSKSPNYVQQRIKLFLHEQMFNTIKELTEEQFQEYKESVRVELIEKDYSLNKESGRFWLELQKHQGLFNRRQLKLQILPAITIDEVKQFYQQNIIERPRSIEIHAISPTHVEEQKQIGSTSLVSHSIDWIKRRVPLYPDYYSML
ncbi:hypothetical protein pb186bvf_005399 [Paramecium bursaria]